MPKSPLIFLCSHCDAQYPKWTGRCLECGKWGTITENVQNEKKTKTQNDNKLAPKDLTTLADFTYENSSRSTTGIAEFDSVLGGGFVPGSLVLLGGDPGIGKSTLSLQVMQKMINSAKPLYVSGEESGQQIRLRADRLGIKTQDIHFMPETLVERITAAIAKHKPSLCIVDSVQTIYSGEVESEPGSVTQVRACTVKLLEAAKTNNVPIILVGHVTKEGQVAGPKTLEHLVDTVLYLEGDRFHTFRILRSVKNRFGPTNEVGIFEMTGKGLRGVENPSSLFLTSSENLSGSVVTCVMEGSRPLLIEIQALVTKSSYASPQRRASGYDTNRLQLLLAVLQQRTKHTFANMDVHINIVGGMKISDPSTDLAVCQALISALEDKPFDHTAIALGEVGLSGEVRPVRLLDERLKEAKKLGFKKALIPEQKTKTLLEIQTVARLGER